MIDPAFIKPFLPPYIHLSHMLSLIDRYYLRPLHASGHLTVSQDHWQEDMRYVFKGLHKPEIENPYAVIRWRLRRAVARARERRVSAKVDVQRDHLGQPVPGNVFIRATEDLHV